MTIENENILPAPACPHYITERYYLGMVAVFGESAAGTIRCEGCLVNGRPGTERRTRPSKRRDGLTLLERERFLRGRVA